MTDLALLTIDPERAGREWRRAFEWHLDQVPPLMEAMGVLRLPAIEVSRGGSRFDKIQITGGGYIDNVPLDNVRVTADGAIVDAGVTADQASLWNMLVEYTRAVTAWINHQVPVPHAPIIPPLTLQQWRAPRPNADPLSARAEALHLIGWLIDHATAIQELDELEEYREELFTDIRRQKGRYRGANTLRRARPRRCDTCGECAVIVDWIDAANGSPKPDQVGKCKVCGRIYRSDL